MSAAPDALGTRADGYARACQALAAAGIPSPEIDARLLLAEALNIPASQVILEMRQSMTAAEQALFEGMLARRLTREPMSHILGRRMFYGRNFRITSAVLDPRPETETLVELALSEPFTKALDLGTGSGCIALTLLAERPEAECVAVDLSEAALAVARDNAVALGVTERLALLRSDWWQAVDGRFDLIVSNPPYIAEADYADLAPELSFEPQLALTPGGDGLDAYRVIAAQALQFLVPTGRLIVEIGAAQAAAVTEIFAMQGLVDVQTHNDLDGRDRVVSARASAVAMSA